MPNKRFNVRSVPQALIDRFNVQIAKETAKRGYKVTQGEALIEAMSEWLKNKGGETK